MEEISDLSKVRFTLVDGAPKPPPLSKPTFTLAELKAAIPPHCFERSMVKSMAHMLWNVSICCGLFYGAYVVLERTELPFVVRAFGYLAYWFLQGSFMTGLWTIGHECGHYGFSNNETVDDTVGIILHSFVLTPYHSWKFAHRRHHLNTNSCENDEFFVPITESEAKTAWRDTLEDSPMSIFYRIIQMLLVGWMPGYLFLNKMGPKKYRDGPNSHFNPYSLLYTPNERFSILMSDIELLPPLATIGYFIYHYGFSLVFKLYLAPYLVVNAYIVMITYLHHTDTFVPHMREGKWNWIQGAAGTVDRSFGKFIDNAVNHLSDTHVLHHFFPRIPYYNSIEATEAIKPIMGEYYLKDTTPYLSALWRSVKYCQYIADDGKIVFYQKYL
ncbi:delta(12)-acyl-lipid-desaturase-like [Bradysia coprophila]|uniref:delta(12)-acyl-lipid-desaturase-like n=1 Tax=Bradysia coprophila TaxID=38358 RepID=UPI00187D7287|nr:delta(12)-acyl-lipid-desaturase-like [Bradysia coprophila]XP_037041544.1 delta(12)-acyl-lipid-desaturase-like [Bradysia coprophila]